MIHATKPELEQIIRDAANGLIAAAADREWLQAAHDGWRTLAYVKASDLRDARAELAANTETEWRLCWWSSLAGCGLTLAVLWLAGAL